MEYERSGDQNMEGTNIPAVTFVCLPKNVVCVLTSMHHFHSS